jgi:hypothetical protein
VIPVRAWHLGLAAGLLCAACAVGPPPAPEPGGQPVAYVAQGEGPAARFAPVLVPQRTDLPYNRVGTPVARTDAKGRERITIDPDRPAVYFQAVPFTTPRGAYTNLVYRVHFPKVPYRMRFSHVSAGPNMGLLVIVTVDANDTPLLVTTVDTCGCYLAFLPTAFLPADAYPAAWPAGTQKVYGERLPARLALPAGIGAPRLVLGLREGTHRVRDAALRNPDAVASAYGAVRAPLLPMADLDRLPLPGGGTTSLFVTEGHHRGFVKGSHKPFERLLVSWWALDWRVGVDKRYGPREAMDTVFYTSLKPWAREESDMWRFADFLAYWGWKL